MPPMSRKPGSRWLQNQPTCDPTAEELIADALVAELRP
jgi:hypothetical protein